MRKIYTVVFALMVLLSVTMSAMAAPAPETTASAPDGDAALRGGVVPPAIIPDDDARAQNAQTDAFA
jgi:Spy/CpxP family protein refolding chaperone